MTATIQPHLVTERLDLRPRRPGDLARIAAMNADPKVMRHIAPVGDPSMGVEGLAKRSFTHVGQGLGYWTITPRDGDGDFLGYVGLLPPRDDHTEVEISYRFEARHWGQGYAGEATSCLVSHAFTALALAELAIVTHPQNAASLRLAERLGFSREADRPEWLIGDPALPCAFLRLTRANWRAGTSAVASSSA